jgi:hypothetical protein
MEQQEHMEQEAKKGLPKTPQTSNESDGLKAKQEDEEHRVPSEKKIDLSDEDKALDSGI